MDRKSHVQALHVQGKREKLLGYVGQGLPEPFKNQSVFYVSANIAF